MAFEICGIYIVYILDFFLKMWAKYLFPTQDKSTLTQTNLNQKNLQVIYLFTQNSFTEIYYGDYLVEIYWLYLIGLYTVILLLIQY